jgi:hypothetical protein
LAQTGWPSIQAQLFPDGAYRNKVAVGAETAATPAFVPYREALAYPKGVTA